MRIRKNSDWVTPKFYLTIRTRDPYGYIDVPMTDGIPTRVVLHSEYDVVCLTQMGSKGQDLAKFRKEFVSVASFREDEEGRLNFYELEDQNDGIAVTYLNCQIINPNRTINYHYRIAVFSLRTPLAMSVGTDVVYDGTDEDAVAVYIQQWHPSLPNYLGDLDLLHLGGFDQPAFTLADLRKEKLDNIVMRDTIQGKNYIRTFTTSITVKGIHIPFMFMANMSAHPYFDSVNVKGTWIHIMNSNLTLVEDEIKAIQGEICVSIPSDPSLFAHKENFIGLLFTGTVSYLYKGDCWSETIVTARGKYRIPSQENTGEPARHEGFLDPRTAKFEGFVVGGEAAYKHVKTHHPHAVVHLVRRTRIHHLRVTCWLPEFKEMKKFGITITPSRIPYVGKSNRYRVKIDYMIEWDSSNPVHKGYIEEIPDHCVYPEELWKLTKLRNE